LLVSVKCRRQQCM